MCTWIHYLQLRCLVSYKVCLYFIVLSEFALSEFLLYRMVAFIGIKFLQISFSFLSIIIYEVLGMVFKVYLQHLLFRYKNK